MRYFALKLVGITVAVFIVQMLLPWFTDLFLLTQQAFYQPWRFVTPIFLHGDLTHIMFNMLGVALFGSILEQAIGSRKFLYVYFGTGIIGNIVGVFFYDASLGASGALMGVLGCLALLRPNLVVWVSYMPMPMWVAVFVWAGMDIFGAFDPAGRIANIVHLVGLGSGLIIGAYWKNLLGEYKAKRKKVEVFTPEEWDRWHNKYMK